MEIERLSARVEADTVPAEVALGRLNRKLNKVAEDRTARVSIFYTETGEGGGTGGGGNWSAPRGGAFGMPDFIPGDGGGGGGRGRNGGMPDLLPGDVGNPGGPIDMLKEQVQGLVDEMGKLPDAMSGLVEPMQGLTKQATGLGESASGAAGGMGALGKAGVAVVGVVLLILPAIMALIPAIIALGGYVVGLVVAFMPLVGILMALPGLLLAVVGIFGVMMLVMKPLMEAFTEKSAAMEDQAKNAQAVKSATDSLAQAEYRHALAVRANANARRDAAEAMEDAQFAAVGAQIGEERAVLALERAYARLSEVQGGLAGKTEEITKVTDDFTGKQFEVARITYDSARSADDLVDAQLGVREAELGVAMAKDRNTDAQIALNDIMSRGIEMSDIVVSRAQAETAAWNALADARTRVAEAEKTNEGGKAYGDLGPEGQKLVDSIYELVNGPLAELGNSLIEAISPALLTTLETLKPLIEQLGPILTPIATGLGDMISGIAEAFVTDANIAKLQTFADGLGTFLAALGPIIGNVMTGFLDLIIAAEPLLTASMDMLTDLSERFAEWAGGDSEMGDLGPWFEQTAVVMQDTLDILFNLMTFMTGFMKATEPFATWVRDNLVNATEDLSDWSNSDEGAASIAGFFERIKEPLEALVGLFGDIFGGLMAVFGSQEAMDFLVEFIRVTREDVLPALFGLLDTLIKSGFMTGLTQFIGAFVQLLGAQAKMAGLDSLLSIVGDLMSMFAIFIEIFAGFLNMVSGVTSFPLDMVSAFIGSVDWQAVAPLIEEGISIVAGMVGDTLGNIWDGIWDGLLDGFWVVYDAMVGPLNSLIDTINIVKPGQDIQRLQTSEERQKGIAAKQAFADAFEGWSINDIATAVQTKVQGYINGGGGAPPPVVTQNNTFNNQADPAATAQANSWSLAGAVAKPVPPMIAAPKPAPAATRPRNTGGGTVRYS